MSVLRLMNHPVYSMIILLQCIQRDVFKVTEGYCDL